MNNDTIEKTFTCNELLDHVNNSQEDDIIECNFKAITAHGGLIPRTHPNYNGSPYNIKIEKENGKITNNPLSITSEDAPVSCATHGRCHNVLDEPSWKRFNYLAKRDKKLIRL